MSVRMKRSKVAMRPMLPTEDGPVRTLGSKLDREADGTGPFRSLGTAAAQALMPGRRPRTCGKREDTPVAPSGLLTQQAWEAELVALYGEVPDRCEPGAEDRDRQFAHWVHAEAKTLASRLERLLQVDLDPTLAGHLRAVADALWADVDWARRRADGSLDGF